MRTWYVSNSGSGDGSSAAAASNDIQKTQSKCGPGDTLLLKAGDRIVSHQWPAINRKGCHGMKIAPYDGTQSTLVYDSTDAITFLLSDSVTISGINIEEAGRDPSQLGFIPQHADGHNAIHFSGCNSPTVMDVGIRWARNGIVGEVSNNQSLAPATLTRVRMKEIWCNDASTQGQGVFMMGMSGWLLDHCDFDEVGWHHLVPGSATMFRHGVYSHHLPGVSGPYIARYCNFRMCASSGPSADSGCELDHCLIWNCSNVPGNLPGAGAFQAWGGGAQSNIHDCTVFGKGPGLQMLAPSGQLVRNTIFWDGVSSPLGVDLQQGGAVKQRDATMLVTVDDNRIIVPAGVPVPPNFNPVSVGHGGPGVQTGTNPVYLA